MEPSDIETVAALEREIFPDPWSEKDVGSVVHSKLSMSFVALSGEEIVGYLLGSLIVPEGEILRIATAPRHRRRGIGARLLSDVLRRMMPEGLEEVFLEVRESNAPARALYSDAGFAVIGKRKKYYKDPEEDAVLMHLSLGREHLC
jgi:ribosomal-protein-alanine N-acetyltransferase